MYDKDWADGVCKDMRYIHPSFKESLRGLIKVVVIYAGTMLSVGGVAMTLSFVASKYKLDQKVQTIKTDVDNNSIDTLHLMNTIKTKQK